MKILIVILALLSFNLILTQNPVDRRFSYVTGSNRRGALGNSSSIVPAVVNLSGLKISSVCLGSNHILVTSNNSVYVWGDNSVTSLGSGSDVNLNLWTPTLLSQIGNFTYVGNISITCGLVHSHVYNSNTAFSFGDSTYFQTGSGTTTTIFTPTLITAVRAYSFSKIFDVGHASFGLTNDGRIFGWGRNDRYQLGAFSNNVNQQNPAYLFNMSLSMVSGAELFSIFLDCKFLK
jgi:alpha-tubulin suppressor-like RCC1 family protein